MTGYIGKNARQRELEKLYNKLCNRYSRYDVWQDMVMMIACSIANAMDKRHFDRRETMYMRAVQKYDKGELAVFPELFSHIVLGMEENPDCDFLGELYMDLELGNKYAGQFFTPYSICRSMAEIIIDPDLTEKHVKEHGYISINDCACGAGAMLVATANVLRKHGINYQQQALFVAQNIDYTAGLMCYIQLSLLGCAGYVHIGNTLTEPMTGPILYGDGKDTTWYTPMYFSERWSTLRAIDNAKRLFSAVATAPPPSEAAPPIANMLEAESYRKADSIPPSESDPEKAEQNPKELYQPTFTISTKKKNKGQIMFDFG